MAEQPVAIFRGIRVGRVGLRQLPECDARRECHSCLYGLSAAPSAPIHLP